jgi:hypothetical protein
VERIGELAVVVGIVEALDVITACWIQSLEDVVDFNHPKRLWPAMCADIRPIGPRPG